MLNHGGNCGADLRTSAAIASPPVSTPLPGYWFRSCEDPDGKPWLLHSHVAISPLFKVGAERQLRITVISYGWNGGKRTVNSARRVRWFR